MDQLSLQCEADEQEAQDEWVYWQNAWYIHWQGSWWKHRVRRHWYQVWACDEQVFYEQVDW
jgi:hypothetical protein